MKCDEMYIMSHNTFYKTNIWLVVAVHVHPVAIITHRPPLIRAMTQGTLSGWVTVRIRQMGKPGNDFIFLYIQKNQSTTEKLWMKTQKIWVHGKSHPPFPSILSWQAQCTLAQCAGHSCPSQTKIRWTWTHSVHIQEHTIAHLLYRNTNWKCWSSKQKQRRFLVQSTNNF